MTAPVPLRILSFAALRQANRRRLPQFKNALGKRAHATADGSDWTPAQWLQALIGEVGEYARVRHLYEQGELDDATFAREARKELADIQCYLDLLCMRALDRTANAPSGPDASQTLQKAMAGLGEYANWRKKFQRGDIDLDTFRQLAASGLAEAQAGLHTLAAEEVTPPAVVVRPHAHGVDLGAATAAKFNEVSRRVGVDVFLPEGGQGSEPQ